MWVQAELVALATLVVRVEAEPSCVEAAQQHHPRRRPPVEIGRRDHHVVGLVGDRGDRLVVPAGELHEGVGVDGVLGQRHPSAPYVARATGICSSVTLRAGSSECHSW